MSALSITDPIKKVPFSPKGASNDDFVFGPEGSGGFSLTVGEIVQAIKNLKADKDVVSNMAAKVEEALIGYREGKTVNFSVPEIQLTLSEAFTTFEEKSAFDYFGEAAKDLVLWELIKDSAETSRLVQKGYIAWDSITPHATEWYTAWIRLHGMPSTIEEALSFVSEWEQQSKIAGAEFFDGFGGVDKQ